MKIGVIAISGMLSVAVSAFAAEPIESRVIHDYDYFAVGYGYLHDLGDTEGHGAVGEFSYEEANFVFNVGGGYFWVPDTDPDVNLWSVSAGLGYVVRALDNRLNIIPRVAGAYSGITVDDEGDETWSILPGVGASVALCNWFAINGGYTYGYNFDSEDGDHFFNAGAKVALAPQIGIGVNANFAEDGGFSGATAVLEFHY